MSGAGDIAMAQVHGEPGGDINIGLSVAGVEGQGDAGSASAASVNATGLHQQPDGGNAETSLTEETTTNSLTSTETATSHQHTSDTNPDTNKDTITGTPHVQADSSSETSTETVIAPEVSSAGPGGQLPPEVGVTMMGSLSPGGGGPGFTLLDAQDLPSPDSELLAGADAEDTEMCLGDIKLEVKDETDEMMQLREAITEVQTIDGQLFEAKVSYQKDLNDARKKLYKMYKAHRKAIEKAKPYFVAKELENELNDDLILQEEECDKARTTFDDVKMAEAESEQNLKATQARSPTINNPDYNAALERWNRATDRVLESSRRRADLEDRFRKMEEQFLVAQRSADLLIEELKSEVQKAWPYYTMKSSYEKQLERQRSKVHEIGRKLAGAKERYREIFSRLNLVATTIQQRKSIGDQRSNGKDTSSHNLSDFQEVTDIDTVLSVLEAKAENLSSKFDYVDDEVDEDIKMTLSPPFQPVTLAMSRSKSLYDIELPPDLTESPKKANLRDIGRSKSLTKMDMEADPMDQF